MSIPPIFLVWLAVSLFASGVYGFAFLHRPPGLLRAVVKTAAVGALAAAFAQLGAGPLFVLIVVALALSALGDFFLAFDRIWTLALGILTFLIAQLAYVLAFFILWMMGGDIEPISPPYRYAASILVIVAALGFLAWLWREPATPKGKPHAFVAMIAALILGFIIPIACVPILFAIRVDTIGNIPLSFWLGALAVCALLCFAVWLRRDVGAMRIAIMPYAATLSLMAFMAMWAPSEGWPAMLGAALFLVSDGVLAAELFKLPADAPVRRITSPIVWWTYYAAQLLLAAGLILAARSTA